MRHGIVLFTSDRGITPAQAAKAAEDAGFDTIYVPEHTHIPVKRDAAHPGTGDETLPDDRYMRTLDPWVSLATAAAITTKIRLSTAVALPVESDPITLAKTIATLDHLSGGRVTIGAGFGWNTDELTDHHVPAAKRRTVLREYLEAMRALWTQDEASYDGEFVTFGASWAWPKPTAGRGPGHHRRRRRPEDVRLDRGERRRLDDHAVQADITDKVAALKQAWADAGREGSPEIHVLVAMRPPPRTGRAGRPPASPSSSGDSRTSRPRTSSRSSPSTAPAWA